MSSGTAAIHLALKVASVGSGDIVFCQDHTFSASANPIIYQNAKPVFIDSDLETWNKSPEALEQSFKKYTPKAVLIVHLYGLSADMDKITDICKILNVTLIEDAAGSLGTYYKDKHTGTFGDYGLFSFNGNKIITTSGGGMLVSDNEEHMSKVKFWATQSREPARHYQHKELGFNLNSMVVKEGGCDMLKEKIHNRRKEILKIAKLHGVNEIKIFGSVAKGEEKKSSDIDFLVEFQKGKSLFDLISLEDELEKLLGRSVDVVTKKSLNKYIRNDILKEAIDL